MNYYFTGILIILMTLLALFGGPKAFGDSTQTNVSGSNTAIEGGILQNLQLHMNQVLNLHQQLITLQIQTSNLHHHQHPLHHIML